MAFAIRAFTAKGYVAGLVKNKDELCMFIDDKPKQWRTRKGAQKWLSNLVDGRLTPGRYGPDGVAGYAHKLTVVWIDQPYNAAN